MAGGQAAGHQPGVTAARPRHACTCTATTIEMAPNCFSFSIADLKTTYLLCPCAAIGLHHVIPPRLLSCKPANRASFKWLQQRVVQLEPHRLEVRASKWVEVALLAGMTDQKRSLAVLGEKGDCEWTRPGASQL